MGAPVGSTGASARKLPVSFTDTTAHWQRNNPPVYRLHQPQPPTEMPINPAGNRHGNIFSYIHPFTLHPSIYSARTQTHMNTRRGL